MTETKDAARVAVMFGREPRPEVYAVMPIVNGVHFRCPCTCNVFTRSIDPVYGELFTCNACEQEYQGT
jgi:hypothetical protein